MIPPTETLYIKKGRRYIPWGNLSDRDWHDGDPMQIGTFRLIHCPAPGHYRYQHDVIPDTAAFLAACDVAQVAMENAMAERAVYTPDGGFTYTAQQQAIIERFRKEMAAAGAMLPVFWQSSSPRDIAEAGIAAVRALAADLSPSQAA